MDNISKSDFNINPPLKNAWDYNADAGFSRNCITISDGVVFASTLRGDVSAFDIRNGSKLGNFSVNGISAYSAPRITGKYIFFTGTGNGKNYLYNYSHQTSSLAWKRRISACESSPVTAGNNVLVTCTNGSILCFDSKTGSYLWQFKDKSEKISNQFYTTPSVKGNIIYAGNVSSSVYALNAENGSLVWKYKAGGALFSDISIKGSRLYFGCDDGNYYCIDSTGRNVWKQKLNTRFLSSSTFYGNTVITGGIDGNLYSLDINNGAVKWIFSTKGTLWASPVLHKDYIFIGSMDRYFYIIEASEGRLIWKREFDKRLRTTAALWENYVVFGCEDKYIYCLKGN